MPIARPALLTVLGLMLTIDTAHAGSVTLPQIQAFMRAHRAAHPANPPG